MAKRAFIIVLDSLGIGAMPDAGRWGDEGSNTLGAIRGHREFDCPTLTELGLFNIDGVGGGVASPKASFAKNAEASLGKDTTVGHWEIAGVISSGDLPTFPDGFPDEIITAFKRATGRNVLCNKPYSGTEVIKDYGEEHIRTGSLIVYTSADSVFQIAAHEDIVPIEQLYEYCEAARKILDSYGVGRVIARPFAGKHPFVRTANRHDYSIVPPQKTMLDILSEGGLDVIAVGKIYDIFAGRGITQSYRTKSNGQGMDEAIRLAQTDFCGLCFVNLVDFDSAYGHRNDTAGYARAMTEFDRKLALLLPHLREGDMLIITADHGCDPTTASTDHSREYTPLLVFGERIRSGINLGTRQTFADISATVLEFFGQNRQSTSGKSFLHEVKL
ncbi:MAG: phosphopentomutase [Clostridiales bacterium]|nr:phosphopentomutase [Clostridiales bacterium]